MELWAQENQNQGDVGACVRDILDKVIGFSDYKGSLWRIFFNNPGNLRNFVATCSELFKTVLDIRKIISDLI